MKTQVEKMERTDSRCLRVWGLVPDSGFSVFFKLIKLT